MANRYFVFSGTNYSTSLTSNWSTFSNGIGGATLPGNGDSIYFDQFSPTCSADLTIASVSNIYFTGYNKTFNFYTSSYDFYANGFLTLSPSMSWGSYSNTANLTLGYGGYGTVSTNGLTWSGNIVYHYRNYVQLLDDAVALGNLTIAPNSLSNTSTFGIFQKSISIYGDLSCITSTTSTNNFGCFGTSLIYLKATQSISVTFNTTYSSNRFFCNPIHIQASSASGITVSFTGTLNYNYTQNYNYALIPSVIPNPAPAAGIFYYSGNIDMSNFNYYYTRSGFDGNNRNVRYPVTLDLKGNFISQVVSSNLNSDRNTIGYIVPLRILSNITIGTLSIVSTASTFGTITLYGGSTFSINNLYLDKYLYLGTTNSVYINNIIHTGTQGSHAQISSAPYAFNGNINDYSNPTIILPSTYSTSYLDVVRITVSQSAIIATSSIILNSINASNPTLPVYFIGSSATNSWFSQSNWSLSSGGAPNANFIPDTGDTVYFDANSGTCSISGAIANAYNLYFTGYKNTIITNANLVFWGNNLIISPSMSFTGSAGLILSAITASVTTTNMTFSIPITLSTPYLFYYNWYPNVYYNFNGNLISNRTFLYSGQHFYATYNQGNGGAGLDNVTSFYTNNNFIYSNNTFNSLYSNQLGSSTFSFGATRLSYDVYSSYGLDMLIDAGSGTFTMSNALYLTYLNSTKLIKYISGTTVGNTINLSNNGTFNFDLNSNSVANTINTTGLNLVDIASSAATNTYISLISPINITGNINLGSGATDIRIYGSILYCNGLISHKNNGGSLYIERLYTYGTNTGYRTSAGSNPTSARISELVVQTGSVFIAATFGVVGNTNYTTTPIYNDSNFYIYGTLSFYYPFVFRNNTGYSQSSLWIYGGVDKTKSNLNLIISGTVSFYTPTTTIDNLYLNQTSNTNIIPQNTLNITNFRADYNWTSNYTIGFTGSYGLNINNFYHDTTSTVTGVNRVAATYLFNNGVTYSFSGTFSVLGNYLYTAFSSYTASNPAKLILNQGTKINANYMNITNIDCSRGLTLRYFKGTSTNSPNTLSFNTTDFLPIINSGMS